VQVDNATGENKNRWIFGILALFVFWGWFTEVEMNMLVKGHTHDVQDAEFGVMQQAERKEGAMSCSSPRPSCVPACRRCHLHSWRLRGFPGYRFSCVDKRPKLAVMDNAIDFKSLLQPFITVMSGHTGRKDGKKTGGPRAFRFRKLGVNNVGMEVKEYAGSKKLWHGNFGGPDPIPIFLAAGAPPLAAMAPMCSEPTVLPTTLESDIKSLTTFFARGDSLVPGAAPDPCPPRLIAWLKTVLSTKSLGAVIGPPSPGVGCSALLPAALFDRVPVRLIEDRTFCLASLSPDGRAPAPEVKADPLQAAKDSDLDAEMEQTIVGVTLNPKTAHSDSLTEASHGKAERKRKHAEPKADAKAEPDSEPYRPHKLVRVDTPDDTGHKFGDFRSGDKVTVWHETRSIKSSAV